MFIFLDTETTGNGPDDRLCQIDFKPSDGPVFCGLFNPVMPMVRTAKTNLGRGVLPVD